MAQAILVLQVIALLQHWRARSPIRLRARILGLLPQASRLYLSWRLALADKGVERALADDPGFAAGLNVAGGKVVHPAVAEALGLPLGVA